MTSQSTEGRDTGKGLALIGLVVGLLTGLAAYGVIEFWIDDRDDAPLPISVLFFIVTAAAAYLLIAERNRIAKAAIAALAIAGFLFFPDYFLAAKMAAAPGNLSELPVIAWFVLGRGLAAYLLIVLAKAVLESGAPPHYAEVFFHGLTMPLILAGSKLFAGLALVLLFVWARLLKELDVNFFNKLFQEPWFILPFLGAVGGISIATMRGQQAVLGALRFVLILLGRILILITALFTVTLLLVLITKGVEPVFDRAYPAIWMMMLALLGMLIFNGVYQNGEGEAPPLWLRIPTLITLIGFPVYAWLGFAALGIRIGEYGLTPPRVMGLAINGLTATYALVCLAGLISEINWRSKKWMAPVGPLNTAMAALWIVVLTTLATPLADPWRMSAKSQYKLLAEEKVSAEDFDFGYVRFELGADGEKVLDQLLAIDDHPEAEAILKGVSRARAAKSRWEYDNPDLAPKENPEPVDPQMKPEPSQG